MTTSIAAQVDSSSTNTPDWSRTSDDYAKHRAGFPAEFYSRLAARRLLAPGSDALDLGTGTGTVAAALGARGLNVTAVDVAEGQLAHARAACRGLPVVVRRASAEDTGLPDASFDLAIAGTAWHWFDAARAGAEARRVLRPGGSLVIAVLDWLSRPDNLIARSWALVGKHRTTRLEAIEALVDLGPYPRWNEQISDAGFVAIESFGFELTLPYSPEAWRGRMRASTYVGATLGVDEVAAFDADLAAMLEDEPLDERGLMHVPHRVFATLGRRA